MEDWTGFWNREKYLWGWLISVGSVPCAALMFNAAATRSALWGTVLRPILRGGWMALPAASCCWRLAVLPATGRAGIDQRSY